jgi:hypothetical protein
MNELRPDDWQEGLKGSLRIWKQVEFLGESVVTGIRTDYLSKANQALH